KMLLSLQRSPGCSLSPRFEMPYNIWCDGCQNHIGMGECGRRFRMKCHLCPNHIEMQTDPANCEYVIVSGARRKEERWDMESNEQILTTEHQEKQKLETDPMYRLEHGSKDQSKLQRAIPTLHSIQEAQSAWKDDFALNSLLRRKFREEKKVLKEEEERDLALQTKASLSIPLVQESEEDRRLAALLKYHSLDSYEDKQKLKRNEISSRPWFSPVPAPGTKASDILRKLGLGPKAAPGKVPLVPSPLGLVRRKSGEGVADAKEPVDLGAPADAAPQEGGGLAAPTEDSLAAAGGHLAASLVADYSDSEPEGN
uniref:Probable splicing factor YJU2B n=1 Tax=Sphenodon punctatus TaxID=8508 RepID=A0A8D0G168_SPHPU